MIDGQPLALHVDATYEPLLAGEPVPVSGCSELTLGPGWHELGGDGQVRVNTLRLETGPSPALAPAADARVPVLTAPASPTRTIARFTANGPTMITTGQSYDRGWTATVNGRSLGPPRSGDTLSTWVVDRTGDVVVEMRFHPDQRYSTALAVSVGAALLCLVIVLWRVRRD
jgi:hypothetical protein